MEGSDGDATVFQSTDVRSCAELAVHGVRDGLLNRSADFLHDRGQNDRLVVGGRFVPVGVNTHDVGLAIGLCSSSCAQAHRTSDGHDDVSALVDELLCLLLAQCLVIEGLGEGAILGCLVPAENLDVRALCLVVGCDTIGEAVHEDGNRRNLDATEGGDLAGLAHSRCGVTSQVSSFSGVEEQRTCVLNGYGLVGAVREGRVNKCVVDVLVLVCRGVQCLLQVEANADDQIAAVGDH